MSVPRAVDRHDPTDHRNHGVLFDLGALGIGDRWPGLAIATWRTRWNYQPGWEWQLPDAHGTEPDRGRTAYCRLLADLGR